MLYSLEVPCRRDLSRDQFAMQAPCGSVGNAPMCVAFHIEGAGPHLSGVPESLTEASLLQLHLWIWLWVLSSPQAHNGVVWRVVNMCSEGRCTCVNPDEACDCRLGCGVVGDFLHGGPFDVPRHSGVRRFRQRRYFRRLVLSVRQAC